MTISLAKDVEASLQERVRDGGADASQLVNDVLRVVLNQQSNLLATPELEAWLLEAADKPVTPLCAEDFARIRERVRARVSPPPK